MKIDRVVLNLISLLVAGTGVFSALTKFYVPELDASFFGHNPFAIKANTIDDITTMIFIGLGIVGLILQAAAIIFDDKLPKAVHSKCFYIILFLAGLGLSLFGIWAVKNVGYYISKQIWAPKVIESQREIYNNAKFILDHDGWRQEQLAAKDALTDPEKYRRANLEQAETDIIQIEKLLDVKTETGALQNRIIILYPNFNK